MKFLKRYSPFSKDGDPDLTVSTITNMARRKSKKLTCINNFMFKQTNPLYKSGPKIHSLQIGKSYTVDKYQTNSIGATQVCFVELPSMINPRKKKRWFNLNRFVHKRVRVRPKRTSYVIPAWSLKVRRSDFSLNDADMKEFMEYAIRGLAIREKDEPKEEE